MQSIRVLLADDHETVRQGLRLLVESQPDMHVIGEARDGRAAIASVCALHPDVLVLDVSMPEMNGLEAAQILRDKAPGTAVVALTRFSDEAYVTEFMRAGGIAYVLKQSSSRELIDAIRAAASGKQYLDSALGTRISIGMKRATTTTTTTTTTSRITERETEVLRMMALGHSNKEIASVMDVSVKTVEVHKANAMRKLGLRGRIDVVRFAILQGWLKET